MPDDTLLPANWATMTSKMVGSETRDTNEPGGSKLLISLDVAVSGVDDPLELDFMDFSLPSLKASAYSTALLAQKKWMTMGVSRLVDSDQIAGSIECSCATYAILVGLIGAKATARIEVPNQGQFSQWRVAILSVDGPAIRDGDRMTGNLVLTVTNTAPDDKSEMGPVFGSYTPTYPDDGVTGPSLTPTGATT